MFEENADGEIHPINDELAYVLSLNSPESTQQELLDIQSEFIKKYCQYIFEVNKDLCLDILFEHYFHKVLCNQHELFFSLRPPCYSGALAQHMTYAMKFKRHENDDKFFEKNEGLHE